MHGVECRPSPSPAGRGVVSTSLLPILLLSLPRLPLFLYYHCNKIHHLARGKPGLEDKEKGKRLKKRMTVLIKSITYVIWSKSLGFPLAQFLHLQVRRFCKSIRCRSGTCACSVTRVVSTLCDPIYCNPPGPSVYEILQARILE